MSMALDKTMEVVDQYDRPDYLEKYKNTFLKFSKFYKGNDIEEMLYRTVNRVDVVNMVIETLDYKRESAFWAKFLCRIMDAQSEKRRVFPAISGQIALLEEQKRVIEVFETMCSHCTEDVTLLWKQALLGAFRNGQVAVVLYILNSQNAKSVMEAVDAELPDAIKEYQRKFSTEKEEFEACDGEMFIIKERIIDKTFADLIKEYKENGIINRTVESFFDEDGWHQLSEQKQELQRKELSDYFLNPLDSRMDDILEGLAYECLECDHPEWHRFYENDISSESLNELAFNYVWDDGFEIPYLIAKHKNCDKGTALNLFSMADGFGCLEREMDGEKLDSESEAFVHALLYRITHDYYADGAVKNTEHFYSVERIPDYRKMGIPDYFFRDSDLKDM